MEKQVTHDSKVRNAPNDFDARKSPRSFVSILTDKLTIDSQTPITQYTKMMKDSRVFLPDGRMRVIRTNIHP